MTDVELIYQAYPRHIARRFALVSIEKAIMRIICGETGNRMTRREAVDYLLGRTTDYANSFAGHRGALTPHPSTWMNQSRYMDDPGEWDYITPDEEKRLARSVEANVGVYRPQ